MRPKCKGDQPIEKIIRRLKKRVSALLVGTRHQFASKINIGNGMISNLAIHATPRVVADCTIELEMCGEDLCWVAHGISSWCTFQPSASRANVRLVLLSYCLSVRA